MTLHELADRLALRDLVTRYAAIPDDRNYALVDEVFSEDGELVGPGFSLVGRDQIRAAMQGIEQYSATLHCVHNQTLELAGDSAEGVTYCIANHLHEVDGVPHKLDWGIRYNDLYRRDSGGWRIARRELLVVWEQDLPLQGTGA
ncbi:MAG: nuclear transport factor 2 family protein [Deltaproteobacteria bacterium]|nr:nuclear transport factor 2 family protein [Deltaproteobacteria bacterium]MBW2359377.1 nuclear transport factor 2 family protein [Deltaproteobacteria bacterium]